MTCRFPFLQLVGRRFERRIVKGLMNPAPACGSQITGFVSPRRRSSPEMPWARPTGTGSALGRPLN